MQIGTKTPASGSLRVSEEVVGKIARLAASEVEGVAIEEAVNGNKRLAREESGLPALAGKLKNIVKVRLSKEAAEIDISIVALAGFKAASTGENVQAAIKAAVQNMAGIAVSKVNVKITGVKAANG